MKVALIGYVWPEPTSSAAGFRTLQLLEAFRAKGWETHLLSSSAETPSSNQAKDLGVTAHAIQMNHSSFDELIRSLSPDFVVFDRFLIEEQFGSRVRAACPSCVRVIDTVDLHFVRRGREELLKRGASPEAILGCEFETQSEDAIREISAIYRSDLSLILSSFELELLQTRYRVPSELLHLSRFHCPNPAPPPSFEERNHFVFIGNFRHPPNADAVTWLQREVWPLVRQKLPQAELHIYGAYPPKEMMALSNAKQGFVVKGPVKDAIECLSHYRVCLAPLRYGAGIKGKITDSWLAGTPVVTTPIGAEGMHDSLEWGGGIASSPAALAQSSEALFNDPKAWSEAGDHGRQILTHLFNCETQSERLILALLNTQTHLASLRQANFVGAMLWHHSHRSTDFFSRWIELKNAL